MINCFKQKIYQLKTKAALIIMKLIYNNICHFNLYKQRSKGTNKNKKKISMNNIKNLKNNKKKKNDQKKLNINNF